MTLDQRFESLEIRSNRFITVENIQDARECLNLSRLVIDDKNAKMFYPADATGARVQHKEQDVILEALHWDYDNGFYNEQHMRVGLIYSDLTMYYEAEIERLKFMDLKNDTYLQYILEKFRSHYDSGIKNQN